MQRASNNLSIIYWHLMHCVPRLIKAKLQFSTAASPSWRPFREFFRRRRAPMNRGDSDMTTTLCTAMCHAVHSNLFAINRI